MASMQTERCLSLQSNRKSIEDANIEQSGGSMSGIITPRGRREPSPAELGLLKSKSIEPQVSLGSCINRAVLFLHNMEVQMSADCIANHVVMFPILRRAGIACASGLQR